MWEVRAYLSNGELLSQTTYNNEERAKANAESYLRYGYKTDVKGNTTTYERVVKVELEEL